MGKELMELGSWEGLGLLPRNTTFFKFRQCSPMEGPAPAGPPTRPGDLRTNRGPTGVGPSNEHERTDGIRSLQRR